MVSVMPGRTMLMQIKWFVIEDPVQGVRGQQDGVSDAGQAGRAQYHCAPPACGTQ